ncbi:unnamed protein product, partial [Timema podura]|nr:unnamed protein product [Timema podura]
LGDTRVNISHDHLSELFHLTVTLTENCPFQLLERLYGSLLVCITHYRNQLDRQQLTQDLETRIFDFDKNILQKFKNNDSPDIIK